jgi:hypothetical protein
MASNSPKPSDLGERSTPVLVLAIIFFRRNALEVPIS